MPVVRKDFPNLLLPHDVHGDAVHQAVLLVGTSFVESQSGEKRFVRLDNHLNTGIVENLGTSRRARRLAWSPCAETLVRNRSEPLPWLRVKPPQICGAGFVCPRIAGNKIASQYRVSAKTHLTAWAFRRRSDQSGSIGLSGNRRNSSSGIMRPKRCAIRAMRGIFGDAAARFRADAAVLLVFPVARLITLPRIPTQAPTPRRRRVRAHSRQTPLSRHQHSDIELA